MPHYPKPFRRKDRGLWYVQIDGKQYNLGRDREQAFAAYHELMAKPKPIESSTVAGVLEGYLVWCHWNRKQRTYDWYKATLQSFAKSLPDPKLMLVSDLKPFHVVGWASGHRKTWSPTTIRMAIIAVQRAFNWAEKMGHIDKSPIRFIEKPEAGRREQIVTEQEYADLAGKGVLAPWAVGRLPPRRAAEDNRLNPKVLVLGHLGRLQLWSRSYLRLRLLLANRLFRLNPGRLKEIPKVVLGKPDRPVTAAVLVVGDLLPLDEDVDRLRRDTEDFGGLLHAEH